MTRLNSNFRNLFHVLLALTFFAFDIFIKSAKRSRKKKVCFERNEKTHLDDDSYEMLKSVVFFSVFNDEREKERENFEENLISSHEENELTVEFFLILSLSFALCKHIRFFLISLSLSHYRAICEETPRKIK